MQRNNNNKCVPKIVDMFMQKSIEALVQKIIITLYAKIDQFHNESNEIPFRG